MFKRLRNCFLTMFVVAGLSVFGTASLSAAQEQSAPSTPHVRRVRISGGVMAGQNLTRVNPVYPEDAREQHISGTVVMHAVIGADGLVKDLDVVSGPEILRNAAFEAVRQWTYKPYLLNGQATEVETTITVNFNLSPAQDQ